MNGDKPHSFGLLSDCAKNSLEEQNNLPRMPLTSVKMIKYGSIKSNSGPESFGDYLESYNHSLTSSN